MQRTGLEQMELSNVFTAGTIPANQNALHIGLETYGEDLETHARTHANPIDLVYSEELVNLIHRCLARQPNQRISARDLYLGIQAAIPVALQANPLNTLRKAYDFEDFDVGNYSGRYTAP